MPVINKPLLYTNTATWNGSGTATVTVDFGFQPDLVWIKPRNNVASNANSHILIDSVRGSDKVLRSDKTSAEVTESNNITAFTSTGITIGDSHNVNKNTTSQYVAWAWKKGATQGFDIVTYTGTGVARTISHSLGVKPTMMIIKNRSGVYDWPTWHQNLPNPTTQHFWLNATNAAQVSGSFNSTQPTSSVFSVGTTSEANENGSNFVAYLFAEVAGFSKFGSYTGNGSADGPFVFCGFRPAFVAIKRTDTTSNWNTLDKARPGYNLTNLELQLNLSAAEYNGTSVNEVADFCSNGFKLRGTGADANASSGTYIFAAFAENPFKYALAR